MSDPMNEIIPNKICPHCFCCNGHYKTCDRPQDKSADVASDQPPTDLKEAVDKINEALTAGLACADQCPLNTTYHVRVMHEARSMLTTLTPLWEKMEREHVIKTDSELRAQVKQDIETIAMLQQERDALKAENENLKSSIIFGKELEQENEKLKAENGELKKVNQVNLDSLNSELKRHVAICKDRETELSTLRQLCDDLGTALQGFLGDGQIEEEIKTARQALTKYNSTKGSEG